MDLSKYPEIKRLFLEATHIDSELVEAYLITKSDNPSVIEEVLKLLKSFHSNKHSTEQISREASQTILKSALYFPNDRYQLIKKIGHGGMGDVYLARRKIKTIEQQVAIKVLQASDELSHQQFSKETNILSQLSHPNISQFIDADFLFDERPYVVMEYVQGIPITDYCAKLNLTETINLFLDLCKAVQHAHNNLIIHQDIKPDNVLVTNNGQVKLLDFGISKIRNPKKDNTVTFAQAMTPSYASPEQIMGKNISILSDVYSLGVLFYELITEALPHNFTGLSLADIQKSFHNKKILKPSKKILSLVSTASLTKNKSINKKSKSLKGDLDCITLKALQFDSKARYQNISNLTNDLQNYFKNQPVNARKKNVSYTAIKFIKRNKLILLTTLILTIFSLFYVITLMRKNIEINKQLKTISEQRDDLILEQRRSENISKTFVNEFYADFINAGKQNTVINHSVHIGNGNLFQQIDLKGSLIDFSLFYNSKSALQTRSNIPDYSVGKGWKHSFSKRLFVGNDQSVFASAYKKDGQHVQFKLENAVWLNLSNTKDQLLKENNQWILITAAGDSEYYDIWGRLNKIHTNDNVFTIESKYVSFSNDPLEGFYRIEKITDNHGNSLLLNYPTKISKHVQKITNQKGQTWMLKYDMYYNLSEVIHPDGTGKKLYYTLQDLPHAITEIGDILYPGYDIQYVSYNYNSYHKVETVTYKSPICENQTLNIEYKCNETSVISAQGDVNRYSKKLESQKWELLKPYETFRYPICDQKLKRKISNSLLKLKNFK